MTFNYRFLRERGMASTHKMEYQVFLCIFQKNSAKFVWKMQKKVWYYEKWVGRHASFPPRRSVNDFTNIDLKLQNPADITLLYVWAGFPTDFFRDILYSRCLRTPNFWLKIMINIQIESHPCYPTNSYWFQWRWKRKITMFSPGKSGKLTQMTWTWLNLYGCQAAIKSSFYC